MLKLSWNNIFLSFEHCELIIWVKPMDISAIWQLCRHTYFVFDEVVKWWLACVDELDNRVAPKSILVHVVGISRSQKGRSTCVLERLFFFFKGKLIQVCYSACAIVYRSPWELPTEHICYKISQTLGTMHVAICPAMVLLIQRFCLEWVHKHWVINEWHICFYENALKG